MPILLDPATAPKLAQLLEAVDTSGLTWHIEDERVSSAALGGISILGLGTLGNAAESELAFLSNPRYQAQLDTTRAGAVILSPTAAQAYRASLAAAGGEQRFALVICGQPYLLYARVGQWFSAQSRAADVASVHPSAVIAEGVEIGEGVHIGPLAVIESGVRIGAGARIGAACIIGRDSSVGADSLLYPRVTLYHGITVGARAIIHSGAVIGADGFGFAPDSTKVKGAYSKIQHFGGVVIGDDVEIGANSTIDRGALEDTVVGNGVLIDDQVMIAHNIRIGDHTAIAACTGIAGSTTIGERCSFGGAAMVGGHITIADDVFITAASVVFASIPKAGRYSGFFPLAEHSEWERNAVVLRHLSRLHRRVKALEK